MKTYGLILFATILTLALGLAAIPQQGVPPASNQANGQPSLAVTMKFLQDKLNGQGAVSDRAIWNAGKDRSFIVLMDESNELSNVIADPATCQLSFHRKRIQKIGAGNLESNGGVSTGAEPPATTETDTRVMLHDVQAVLVMTTAEGWHRANPAEDFKTDPVTYELEAQVAGNSKLPAADITFTTSDLANRVAKAMVHAVELCGGGNKEPF